jgi:hypothetical protein
VRLVALAVLVTAFAAPGPAGMALAPHLRVLSLQPMTVRGVDFRAQERVRVTLLNEEGTFVRRVRANDAGRFLARFSVAVGYCDGWQVVAKGSRGSVARLHRDPRGDCPSP